ncbi:MAG: DUF1638 domain-containing protein [Bryobacterales bacterium]|nr:DUF1638 domain-containing protein [Bryobacterales bacterium]
MPAGNNNCAFIACGALARELQALIRRHDWPVDILALPALLHNRPERIPDAVRNRIRQARSRYARIIVVYGDCGTGGELDAVLAEEGVPRVAGPHCYEMYAHADFEQLSAPECGAFFLTDFLVREFDALVVRGLGLDRYPELRDLYFAHYRRAIYLAQQRDGALEAKAARAAERLKLPLEVRFVGYGALETRLVQLSYS